MTLGDLNPAVGLLQGSPGATKFVSWEATSSLHDHSDGCQGEAGPPRTSLFGLSVVEQVQPIQLPGQRPKGEWLDPSLGRAEGRG